MPINYSDPMETFRRQAYVGPRLNYLTSSAPVSSGSPVPGVTNYSPAYGGKITVPSPGSSAGTATQSNLGNLPSIKNLGSQVNAFNQGQLLDMIKSVFPNYLGEFGKAAGNVGNELAGQFSPDAISQMVNLAANRGIQTGNLYGPGANAALLNMMGTNVTNLQRQGALDFMNLGKSVPLAPQYDITKNFITPDEVQQAEVMNRIYQSAPVPADAAQAAIDAALRGFGGGYPAVANGRVNYPGIAPTFGGANTNDWWNSPPGPGTVVGYSPSTTLTYGPGQGPNTMSNWQQWYNTLPGMGNTVAAPGGGYQSPGYFPENPFPGFLQDTDLPLGTYDEGGYLSTDSGPMYAGEPSGFEWPFVED